MSSSILKAGDFCGLFAGQGLFAVTESQSTEDEHDDEDEDDSSSGALLATPGSCKQLPTNGAKIFGLRQLTFC